MATVAELLTAYLVDLASFIGYIWDASIARYRNRETGRLVAERDVISAIESFNDNFTQTNISRITDRLIDDRITLQQWQEQVAGELKDGWLVNSMAGRGGKNAMTSADYGRVGGRLRYEYQQLNGFAQDIAAGKLTPAQIKARALQYGEGPRTGYFDGKTAASVAGPYMEERRVLGDADHCDVCIEIAMRGWQPIGSLPEPGTQCLGRHNCKCIKEYR